MTVLDIETTTAPAVLRVRGLRVELHSGAPIVDGLDLELASGQILGVVGESGSGKSTAALAMLGYGTPGTRFAAGEISVAGHSILQLDDTAKRAIRGKVISYVPQDAAQGLNPSLRVGQSISDVIRQHRKLGAGDVIELLHAVDLPADEAFARRLPHQLSGGQQQRVTIAMALSCDPPVVVMDEPTTGLDVITQASVLDEIRRLRTELNAAIVYVSHDLAVVSQLADRVAVMYAGRIVEQGPTAQLLHAPRHPYTRGLVQSIPDHRRPAQLIPMPGTAVGVEDRPQGCSFAPRCSQHTELCETSSPPLEKVDASRSVRCFNHDTTPAVTLGDPREQPATRNLPVLDVRGLHASHRGATTVVAAEDVSFTIAAGECLALVGQSGSGKTTIARCLVGLHRPDQGVISLGGTPLDGRIRKRSVDQRRRLQYVFQNPFQSLNPKQEITEQLARPAQVLRGLDRRAALAEVPDLLEQVRLPSRTATRYPKQLSGGERQRVAIARALAARPDVLVCDEITSALDVSVQAAILDVLASLQHELSLAMLLITHDLGVVAVAADRVVIVESGRVRESGSVVDVLNSPSDDYTRRLVAAAPSLLSAENGEPS